MIKNKGWEAGWAFARALRESVEGCEMDTRVKMRPLRRRSWGKRQFSSVFPR